MKKHLKALPIIIFPYLDIVCMACMAVCVVSLSESADPGIAPIIILASMLAVIALSGIVSLAFSIIIILPALRGNADSAELAKLNMIIKLVHVPAYIIHFCLGLIGFVMSVWGIPLILCAIIIDVFTITLSGIVSVGANIAAKKENAVSSRKALLFSILGFIYCVDVVVSIVLYVTVKRKNSLSGTMPHHSLHSED